MLEYWTYAGVCYTNFGYYPNGILLSDACDLQFERMADLLFARQTHVHPIGAFPHVCSPERGLPSQLNTQIGIAR